MKERCIFTETYNQIYERMKNNYIESSGNNFDEASEIAVRMKVMAGEIFNAYSSLEWLKRQMFASSASGEYLDYIARERGIERRQATKAKGVLTFSVEEASSDPILIPRGTVVVTPGSNPLRFYTTEDAVLPLMTMSVSVNAEAEAAGFAGNILAGINFLPVSVPAEIVQIRNNSRFVGGADTETDSSLRERIKDTYYCVPNGMNKAYYQQLAKKVEGVKKVGVVSFARGAGTINVYVSGNEDDISQAVVDEVAQVIQSEREINLDVQVFAAVKSPYNLNVTVKAKAGYTQNDVTELIAQAFEEYLSTIPMGGKLYLSSLGKYLLETGCIENYEFDMSMTNAIVPGSQYFVSGETVIEVI